jgi:hypothetical protein
MLGGAASAKTASYTLVAADAGTAISMTSTSATTITVNTGLFAAGDTVQITNLGTGVCTITAGTATVDTAASLALAQYESGTLDFTSASAAVFIKGAGGAGGGMTLISTTTLSGASVVLSSIPTTYVNLFVVVRNFLPATDSNELRMRFNNDTGANRHFRNTVGAETEEASYAATFVGINQAQDNATGTGLVEISFPDYANTTTMKFATSLSTTNNATTPTNIGIYCRQMFYNQTSAITSLGFFPTSGNFTSGTILLYGVK